jgi:surface protein
MNNIISQNIIYEAVRLWIESEEDAIIQYGHISTWDVSEVTNMSGLFKDAFNMNSDISSWDVSGVMRMDKMFMGASSFNQNLSAWNVSRVLYMNEMFLDATQFNGNVSTWDVSKVITMDMMFKNAISFNQNVSEWNVSNVVSMQEMFMNATSFNQDISRWNSSESLTHNILLGATNYEFDGPPSNLNVEQDIIFASDDSNSELDSIDYIPFSNSPNYNIFSDDDTFMSSPMSLSELSSDNKTIPAEPLNVISFDQERLLIYTNSIGSDIIMGGENDRTLVSEFIALSQADNDVPVIIKMLDKNKKEHDSIYLFTKNNLETMLEDSIVYPCWQNTGYYNVINDGRQDAAPEGVIQNVRNNIQLYSMNNIFQRNILTEVSTVDSHLNSSYEPELKTPIFIVLVPTNTFYGSIAKLPFSAGVSQLHCNPGSSDTLTVYSLQNGNYSNAPKTVPQLGSAKQSRVGCKRNSKKTKKKLKQKNKQKNKQKATTKTRNRCKLLTKTKKIRKPYWKKSKKCRK